VIPLLLLLVAAAPPAECDDRNGDVAAAQCWSRRGDLADAELARVWREARREAARAESGFRPIPRRDKPSSLADLLAAQRAWLRYRDSECRLESDYADGGSLQNVIYGRCYVEMTKARAAQLREIAGSFRES
jgi:uncharacterized protein YecT (DUF1311 family)